MLFLSSCYKKYFQIKINIYLKHERNIEGGFHPLKEFSEKKNFFFTYTPLYFIHRETFIKIRIFGLSEFPCKIMYEDFYNW